jgi:hypothetical protein
MRSEADEGGQQETPRQRRQLEELRALAASLAKLSERVFEEHESVEAIANGREAEKLFANWARKVQEEGGLEQCAMTRFVASCSKRELGQWLWSAVIAKSSDLIAQALDAGASPWTEVSRSGLSMASQAAMLRPGVLEALLPAMERVGGLENESRQGRELIDALDWESASPRLVGRLLDLGERPRARQIGQVAEHQDEATLLRVIATLGTDALHERAPKAEDAWETIGSWVPAWMIEQDAIGAICFAAKGAQSERRTRAGVGAVAARDLPRAKESAETVADLVMETLETAEPPRHFETNARAREVGWVAAVDVLLDEGLLSEETAQRWAQWCLGPGSRIEGSRERAERWLLRNQSERAGAGSASDDRDGKEPSSRRL